jgi:Zn finger protein HypA/HybF involved in hydrogenase expression
MHELSLITNLLKILEKMRNDLPVEEFLALNLTVNPYSCIDAENINFIFRSMTKDNPAYKNTRINITRGTNPASREFILDSVEISQP